MSKLRRETPPSITAFIAPRVDTRRKAQVCLISECTYVMYTTDYAQEHIPIQARTKRANLGRC